MPDNIDKQKQAKDTSESRDEIEELKLFIEKTKLQNVALKKIIAKINTDENSTSK